MSVGGTLCIVCWRRREIQRQMKMRRKKNGGDVCLWANESQGEEKWNHFQFFFSLSLWRRKRIELLAWVWSPSDVRTYSSFHINEMQTTFVAFIRVIIGAREKLRTFETWIQHSSWIHSLNFYRPIRKLINKTTFSAVSTLRSSAYVVTDAENKNKRKNLHDINGGITERKMNEMYLTLSTLDRSTKLVLKLLILELFMAFCVCVCKCVHCTYVVHHTPTCTIFNLKFGSCSQRRTHTLALSTTKINK